MAKRRAPKGFDNVPWITEDGALDVTRFPLDPLLEQSLSEDPGELRSACNLLASRVAHGKDDAVVILLGLMRWHGEDLDRLTAVVDALGHAQTEVVAETLFAELKRVKSTNSTRAYLRRVLETLDHFPLAMKQERFEELSKDNQFSHRMRQRFRALAEGYSYREVLYG